MGYAIDEKIKECDEYFEDLILDGTWDDYMDEQIERLEEEINELGLKEVYKEKLNKFKEVKSQIKSKTFIPIFTPKQAKLIKEIKDTMTITPTDNEFNFFQQLIFNKKINDLRKEVSEAILEKEDNYNEFCLELVKRMPYAISVIENPTIESCLLAFKSDISLLETVLNQTPEMCMVAIELDPEAVKYFRK